jgi:hydroxyacylglutathione hydrolase
VDAAMFFKQIKQFSDNFSYVIAEDATGEAAVVDSSYNVDEIARILKAKNLHLKYIINTYGHSDHTGGNDEHHSTFGARIVAHKSLKAEHES